MASNGGEGLKDESGTYRYSGAINAETTVLKHVNALGAGSLFTNTLKFELDSTSPSLFSDSVTALQAVEIINSDVEYSSEAVIAPTQTTLTGHSTLTVNGTSQLGKKVYFSEGVATADEIALLKINTTATDPFTEVTLESDRTNAVVELVGLGSDKTEYNVDGHNDKYQGWVRISNASFTVDENHNHGLSVGNGGILKVKNKDDNTPIEVTRLGWAIGGNGTGILDLTEFNFTQASNQPALKVTDTIQLDALGEIKVNSQGLLSASTMQGNILNWDNFSVEDGGMQTSNSYRIISVANMPEDIASQITLTDIAEGTSKVDYMNGSTNQKSAEITLGTDVGYVVPGENVDSSDYGVYVFYGMRQINLVGENNEQQSLDLMLAENVDDTLTARITGKGIINVSGSGHQLELNNVRNSFAGNFNVKEGVTVSAHEGSLGAGDVTLDISSDATVKLINSSQESQIIKTLSMQATSKLDIGVDANLFVLNDSTITGTLTCSGTLSVNEGALDAKVSFRDKSLYWSHGKCDTLKNSKTTLFPAF